MGNADLPAMVTRISIWVAVAAWAGVIAGLLRGRRGRCLRFTWTIGLVAYLLHVMAAFAGFYRWSHAVAYAETARQTAEQTGFSSGFGLWLNYLVAALWGIDVARWWITGKVRPEGMMRKLWWGWHVFLAFMIFNGTIVFGHGPVRWYGVAIFTVLAAIAWRAMLKPLRD
ncbi:MAG: hypothetical protein KDN19_05250 [Verrucomicrobiae bacterium]|nr:hypothetical protein [Verrucomicrobiae bacterium]